MPCVSRLYLSFVVVVGVGGVCESFIPRGSEGDVDAISEGDLPAGSNLSGSKALQDDYPEDEANSRKNKKSNPRRSKKGHPKNKA